MQTIIFDWKQTLYDPDTKQLISGARELLDFLKSKDIRLVLIGKGGSDMYDEVQRLAVGDYFRDIIFRDEAKTAAIFKPFVDTEDPSRTLIIGDSIRSELQVGNQLNATTIRVKQGKFAGEMPESPEEEPTYVVGSLQEARELVETLL